MAQPNVLIFIVPGTWHPASAYEPFASKLRRAGYAAEIASLPTFNPKVVDTDCATDTEALRRLLSNLVQAEGRDVVVFAHSYGGMPAGGAAYGLGKSSRARRSEKGGVIGLVYMSAFIIAEGISLSESMGGHSPSYISPDNPSKGLCTATGVKDIFYADVDSQIADQMELLLGPHASLAFDSPAPAPAWAEPDYEGRLLFLRCIQDKAMPTFVQDKILERSGATWDVQDVDASHSAFLSVPETVITILENFVRRLQRE